jgi:thymidine kinase
VNQQGESTKGINKKRSTIKSKVIIKIRDYFKMEHQQPQSFEGDMKKEILFPELIVYTGPMYSGKSTRLLQECDKRRLTQRCLMVNHREDKKRYIQEFVLIENNDIICAHSGKKCSAILVVKLVDEIINTGIYKQYDTILVDEAQFFEDLVEFIELARETYGKNVIIAGLHANYKREPFMNHSYLVSRATEFIILSSVCNSSNCCRMAHQSAANFAVLNKIEIKPGGFFPLCDTCYAKEMNLLKMQ